MKEQLIHILDQSVCLSRKQMKEYLSGTMQREEMHAAEVHLSSCPLCSMAMEGFDTHSEEALAAISSLNSGFLKEHFDNIAPQIHLNSMAPAATLSAPGSAGRRHTQVQPVWRTASIAAAILVLFSILWYIEFGREAEVVNHTAAVAPPSSLPPDNHESAPAASSAAAVSESALSDGASPDEAANDVKADEQQVQPAVTAMQPSTKADLRTVRPEAASAEIVKVPARPAPEAIAALPHSSAKEIETQASRSRTAPIITAAPPVNKPAAAAMDENQIAKNDVSVTTLSAAALADRRESVSLGGGRSTGTKYVVDGIQAAEKAKKAERSHMELGNDSYDKGRYGAALAHYKKQINTGTSQERNKARIQAARCYAALGNKTKAQQLLDTVVNDGSGPEKRAARRLLRSLE